MTTINTQRTTAPPPVPARPCDDAADAPESNSSEERRCHYRIIADADRDNLDRWRARLARARAERNELAAQFAEYGIIDAEYVFKRSNLLAENEEAETARRSRPRFMSTVEMFGIKRGASK